MREPRKAKDDPEASLAADPPEDPDAAGAETRPLNKVWQQLAAIVVVAMDGKAISRAIPELGNSPVVSWKDDGAQRYVGALLRDTILRAYHLQQARNLKDSLDRRAANDATMPAPGVCPTASSWKVAERAIINWAPDPMSLCALQAEICLPQRPNGSLAKLEVIYPDGALSGLELDALEDLFQGIKFRTYGEANKKYLP